MKKKVFIKSYGCQMNVYDSRRMLDLIKPMNYDSTEDIDSANLIILNTCHIREKATEKVYDEIGRFKKYFRNLKKPLVIISGCVAQAESEEMIKREPYIDMVIGPQSYHKIRDLILNYERKKIKSNATEFDVIKKFDELQNIPNSQSKISSNLTIQEGCDKFCHFCVVPYTRGPEYSRPFKQIIDEANILVKNGVREIVLLGQNVNAYNYSENNKNFRLSSLIKELNSIKNLKRIRYMTSHPKDMTEDLIDCYIEYEKLMPLLHLPIQSGSNRVLQSMNRKHDIEYYLSVVKKLTNVNKKIKISSDFIIGYPGEEEKDFDNTIKLIRKVGFISSYSFIFSPRSGTPAAQKKFNDKNVNEKRLQIIQRILENLQIEDNKNYLNKYCEVLVENKLKDQEKYFGRTRYMTPVIFDSKTCNVGELANVKVTSINQKNLFGFHENNKIKAA